MKKVMVTLSMLCFLCVLNQWSFADMSVTLNSLDSAQVYLNSTGGSTSYGGNLTGAGNQVVQFGWFPPGNGYGPVYLLQRLALAFDLSTLTTIAPGVSIDSAVLSSWLAPDQPGFIVRFEPGSITGDVWQLTGGSLATTGVVNISNSASNDFLAPASFIGTIYPTGSQESTAPYTLDVSTVVQSLYTTGHRYAAFQWRINSETAVQTDSTNGYYYSTGDADTTTAYYTHLVVYYTTTPVELSNFEVSNSAEPAATLPQGKMPINKE